MGTEITYIVGNGKILDSIWQEKPLAVFSDESIHFLDSLSRCIRQTQGTEQYPDLRSFAFWCRKQNLLKMKEPYREIGKDILLGRGASLHFVPSNIPLMFAYSMAAAMLAGNTVVMRLPTRTSAQEHLLVKCLKTVMEEQGWMGRILLMRYEHQDEVTRWLSKQCDVRIIWGGNASVETIRQCPLRADALEITFADRKSAAVLDATALLKLNQEELHSLAENFYTDAYLYDQNSCASPSLVYWVGTSEKTAAARERFWNAVAAITQEKYTLSGKIVMEKWENALELAASRPNIKIEHRENHILCIQVPDLDTSIWEDTMYGGFFLECSGENLERLLPALGRTCQTLSYFGLKPEAITKWIASGGVKGVDRIVPLGRTLDFSLVWDGMDLLQMMSRRIILT